MFVLEPVHYYVVVESAPEVMQKLQLADADRPAPSGNIIIPESMTTSGIGSDHGTPLRPGSKREGSSILNLLVGRVMWVGPGRHWEGQFVVPDLKPGELVMFSPRVVSHEFRLHGRNVMIVPWSEMLSKVREVAPDSPEALELRRLLPEAREQPLTQEASG